jgi:hypothetical protein
MALRLSFYTIFIIVLIAQRAYSDNATVCAGVNPILLPEGSVSTSHEKNKLINNKK